VVEPSHNRGCRVPLIDANPQAVCRTLAEKFEQIDLKNTEQICDFARSLKKSEGLDAVFTAGTDFSYAVACAAHECNLSAHTSQAAKNASDKVLMRSCFDKAGVPSPHFVQADSSFAAFNQKQAEDFIYKHKLDFPLVVKPCDNMGARGCRLVRGAESLAEAVKDALRYSRTFRVIIEEYMDGSEFSIDSLVFDGQLTVTGFAERHIYFPPYFIEMGHTMPALIDKTDKERLLGAFWSGVKALGLSCGAAKADIKMTSKGPIFYGHKRVGKNGEEIKCWKFRSMYVNSQEMLEKILATNPVMKKEWEENRKFVNDPRVTPFGTFLRKTSLDELPQLFNILAGSMSFVGPRPVTKEELEKYGDSADFILSVTPGLSGMWQISGRSDTGYEERINLDTYYIQNWSTWFDMWIIVKTVWVVINGKGAY